MPVARSLTIDKVEVLECFEVKHKGTDKTKYT